MKLDLDRAAMLAAVVMAAVGAVFIILTLAEIFGTGPEPGSGSPGAAQGAPGGPAPEDVTRLIEEATRITREASDDPSAG